MMANTSSHVALGTGRGESPPAAGFRAPRGGEGSRPSEEYQTGSAIRKYWFIREKAVLREIAGQTYVQAIIRIGRVQYSPAADNERKIALASNPGILYFTHPF